MAIRDLLWACPTCGLESGIQPLEGREGCRGCGTRYWRGAGSTIQASLPDGQTIMLPAPAWAERLPPVRLPGAGESGAGESAPVEVTTAVEARFQLGAAPIRLGRVFYGRIERLGPPRRGRLTLRAGEVIFQPQEGEERRWPLDALTALQSSSGTLQIKPRREGVVSFRFPDSSVRLWEEVLRASIRRFYRSAGKGEVLEFQPRIVLR